MPNDPNAVFRCDGDETYLPREYTREEIAEVIDVPIEAISDEIAQRCAELFTFNVDDPESENNFAFNDCEADMISDIRSNIIHKLLEQIHGK